MNGPKISMCIPTYNRCKYLDQCITSCLDQSYANFEVIVVDNNSTDNTHSVVQKFLPDERFKFYRNDVNIGLVNNFRKCFEFSTGEWFMIVSDDDYFIDCDYLLKAMQIVSAYPDLSIVLSNGLIYYTGTDRMIPFSFPYAGKINGKEMFFKRGQAKHFEFILCNVLFNKDKANNLPIFSNPNNICCDLELFQMLCLTGDVYVINDSTAVYRVHNCSNLQNFGKNFSHIIANVDTIFAPLLYAKENGLLTDKEIFLFMRGYGQKHLYNLAMNIYENIPDKYDLLLENIASWLKRINLDISLPRISPKHKAKFLIKKLCPPLCKLYKCVKVQLGLGY